MRASRGMTLIEVLVATAILTVLAGTVLVVLAHMTRVGGKKEKIRVSDAPMKDLLRRDLQSAVTVGVSDSGDRLSINGFVLLGPDAWKPTSKQAIVDYTIEAFDNERRMLVRRQLASNSSEAFSEIVAWDVTRISAKSLQPIAPGGTAIESPDADTVRVTLVKADGRETVVECAETAVMP